MLTVTVVILCERSDDDIHDICIVYRSDNRDGLSCFLS